MSVLQLELRSRGTTPKTSTLGVWEGLPSVQATLSPSSCHSSNWRRFVLAAEINILPESDRPRCRAPRAQRDASSDENKARAEEVRGTTRPAVISNRVEWWSRGGAQRLRDGHRMDTARRTVTTTGELLGAKRRHDQTVDASASPRGRNHIQEAEAAAAVHNTK